MCILLSISVTAETVYKKTNPDGSVEFTDIQATDSEEIKVRETTTYKPTGLPSLNLPTKKLRPSFNYTLSISQPENDAVITGQADVVVSVSVQPALLSALGHQIRYQVSGESIVSQSTSATFKDVSRGTHNLTVSIVDNQGEVVSPVASSTIHVKRFFKKPVPPKPKPTIP